MVDETRIDKILRLLNDLPIERPLPFLGPPLKGDLRFAPLHIPEGTELPKKDPPPASWPYTAEQRSQIADALLLEDLPDDLVKSLQIHAMEYLVHCAYRDRPAWFQAEKEPREANRPPEWPRAVYIKRLSNIFELITTRKAGKGKGPFLRFLLACLEPIDPYTPSDETMATAIRRALNHTS